MRGPIRFFAVAAAVFVAVSCKGNDAPLDVPTDAAAPSASAETHPDVACKGDVCEIHAIDAAVKTALEAHPNHHDVELRFDKTSTDADFATIAEVPWIERVDVGGCKLLHDLAPVAKLTDLRELHAASSDVSSLEPLRGLARLELLDVRNTAVRDASPLADVASLERLDVSFDKDLDLSTLAKLRVRSLTLDGFKDVSQLKGLASMKELSVQSADGISDASPLMAFPALEKLTVSSRNLRDLAPLAKLKKLARLDVSYTKVKSLAPIAKLPLEALDIRKTDVDDLTPLVGMKTLHQLTLDADFPADKLARFSDARLDVHVSRF